MPPFPFTASFGQSSGINGDTRSGPLGDVYFAAPMAVGSGSSASASQSGAGNISTPVIIAAVVGFVLVMVAAFRRS